jgi:hypothetical protein
MRTQKIKRKIKDGLCRSRGLNSFKICTEMWTAISLIILLTWGVNPGLAKLLPSPYLQRNRHVERLPIPVEGDVGSRLILTPYIEDGNIKEARSLSAVSGGPFPEDIPSHSGFFTVNKQYNSSLFFWFFPAEVSNSLHVNFYMIHKSLLVHIITEHVYMNFTYGMNICVFQKQGSLFST